MLVKPDQTSSYGEVAADPGKFVCVLLDRHPTRPRRGENRNALRQHLFFVVFCKYEHFGVRVPLFFITPECQTLRFGTFHRFCLGNPGPGDFWTRTSRLVPGHLNL